MHLDGSIRLATLIELAQENNVDKAVELYRWFMPLLHLDVDTKLVQMIKLANQMTSEGREWVRLPRMTLEGDERAAVVATVEEALANRPNV